MDRRRLLAGIGTVTMAGTAGCVDVVADALFGPKAEVSPRAVEQQLFILVNEHREARDLDALAENERAAETARKHAEDMIERDFYDHTNPDGETQLERYAFCDGAENIADVSVSGSLDDQRVEDDIATREVAEEILKLWLEIRPDQGRGVTDRRWNSGGAGVAVDGDRLRAVFAYCQ